MHLLPRLAAGTATADLAAPLHAALSTRPDVLWNAGRGITNAVTDDVQVVRHPAARATVIVLAGVQGGVGYMTFSHVDALLAAHPVNAIYLRDVHNRAFTAGVRGLAPDEPGTQAALRRLAADLGGQPIVTMGASLGGMVAVRLATRIGGHAAISLAGPVHLGMHDEDAGPAGASTRFTMAAAFLRGEPSVPEMLRAAPATRAYQVFGTGYAPDARAATLLDGLPNATPVPLADCAHHFAFEHLIATAAFAPLLERAMATP
jgi:pimeloyl-ACP methyl ester carboxylesterase